MIVEKLLPPVCAKWYPPACPPYPRTARMHKGLEGPEGSLKMHWEDTPRRRSISTVKFRRRTRAEEEAWRQEGARGRGKKKEETETLESLFCILFFNYTRDVFKEFENWDKLRFLLSRSLFSRRAEGGRRHERQGRGDGEKRGKVSCVNWTLVCDRADRPPTSNGKRAR